MSAVMLFCDHVSFAQVCLEQMYSDAHMPCVGMASVLSLQTGSLNMYFMIGVTCL